MKFLITLSTILNLIACSHSGFKAKRARKLLRTDTGIILWEDAIIPFKIEVNPQQKKKILRALNEWSKNTSVMQIKSLSTSKMYFWWSMTIPTFKFILYLWDY